MRTGLKRPQTIGNQGSMRRIDGIVV